MGSQDKALRSTAIPYYANVWGYNRGEFSDTDISLADYLGDLDPMATLTGTAIDTVNAIRVLQPQYGDIIEANLNLRFSLAAADGAREFRVAIGTFSDRYTAETSYSEDYINLSHAKITGRTSPYTIATSGTFSVPRLNLSNAMYHDGDAEYKDDAFVVLLVFDTAPTKGSGYSFTKFEVDCTMQMGLI